MGWSRASESTWFTRYCNSSKQIELSAYYTVIKYIINYCYKILLVLSTVFELVLHKFTNYIKLNIQQYALKITHSEAIHNV